MPGFSGSINGTMYFQLLVGILLLAWAIAGGPVWTYLGLVLLITGSWNLKKSR